MGILSNLKYTIKTYEFPWYGLWENINILFLLLSSSSCKFGLMEGTHVSLFVCVCVCVCMYGCVCVQCECVCVQYQDEVTSQVWELCEEHGACMCIVCVCVFVGVSVCAV